MDVKLRRQGIGETLVNLALGMAREIICPAIGCRFVVVNFKHEAVSFYLRCGFTMLDTPDNKTRKSPVLFIDLHKAAKNLPAKAA